MMTSYYEFLVEWQKQYGGSGGDDFKVDEQPLPWVSDFVPASEEPEDNDDHPPHVDDDFYVDPPDDDTNAAAAATAAQRQRLVRLQSR